jgi:hypothetical protein
MNKSQGGMGYLSGEGEEGVPAHPATNRRRIPNNINLEDFTFSLQFFKMKRLLSRIVASRLGL